MYTAKILSEIEYSPNAWKGLRVGVFRIENEIEEQIGEYERNYSTLFNTFLPFQQNGKNFAFYSPDYTVTRIMELPSCKDIGGEESSAGGFCPTDYFVPTYIEQEVTRETISLRGKIDERISKNRLNKPTDKDLIEYTTNHKFTNGNTGEECKTKTTYRPLSSLLYYPFGFIAGCIWGDDSTWKIQYLDLSEVERGITKRDERFGYIELPDNLSLKEAINMYDYGYDWEDEVANYIRINIMQTFDLRTGKVIHPFE